MIEIINAYSRGKEILKKYVFLPPLSAINPLQIFTMRNFVKILFLNYVNYNLRTLNFIWVHEILVRKGS